MAKQSTVGQANKGGRPPPQPQDGDRKIVTILSSFGIPAEKIAEAIGIDRKTLSKHYGLEIAVGAAKVEGALIGNLYRLAQGTDHTALRAIMFALNCRFGWSRYAPRP